MSNDTISMSCESLNIENDIIRLTICRFICRKVSLAICNANCFVAPLLKFDMYNILRIIFTFTVYHTIYTFA